MVQIENRANAGADALARLRRQIVERGWNRKATFRVLSELTCSFLIAMAGIWTVCSYQNPVVRICAMLVSTAASMGVATNTHTSSHYATSRRRWVNELLTYLGYPVFLGLSACHWWRQHVVLHHPAPNVIGVDEDVDLGPWFARTWDEVQRSSGLWRFYYEKLQWVVFPLAVAFIGFNMQLGGWRSLIRSLRSPGRSHKHWMDLAAMILHYVVWLIIPMLFFAPIHVAEFYVLRIALMGYAMFAVLGPGHFPAEAVCVQGPRKIPEYVLLQTAATVNFRTGLIGRFVCSGLEYQIEHHLFPNLSHNYYSKLAPLMREFCLANDLPYRCYGWHTVLWKSIRMLQCPPRVLNELDGFPGSHGAAGFGSKLEL